MRNLQCPACQQTITLEDLNKHKVRKACIQRDVFPCPHCQQKVKLPNNAETLRSFGILLSVVVSPLLYYWQMQNTLIFIIFALGIGFILTGTLKNQLHIVTSEQNK
jgi:endogenous inhibitor of DNA gyrase (YacG/DUF329 family)